MVFKRYLHRTDQRQKFENDVKMYGIQTVK